MRLIFCENFLFNIECSGLQVFTIVRSLLYQPVLGYMSE
jgi:hypothetical protein